MYICKVDRLQKAPEEKQENSGRKWRKMPEWIYKLYGYTRWIKV